MMACAPIAWISAGGMRGRWGFTTGKRAGVWTVFPPTWSLPRRPAISFSRTSNRIAIQSSFSWKICPSKLRTSTPGDFQDPGGSPALRHVWSRNSPADQQYLRRHLGEEEAAPAIALGDEAVGPDPDAGFPLFRGSTEGGRYREDRDLDKDLLEIAGLNWRKPWVLEGRRYGCLADRLAEGHDRVREADASPELPSLGQGDEDPPLLTKDRGEGWQAEPLVPDRGPEGLPGERDRCRPLLL